MDSPWYTLISKAMPLLSLHLQVLTVLFSLTYSVGLGFSQLANASNLTDSTDLKDQAKQKTGGLDKTKIDFDHAIEGTLFFRTPAGMTTPNPLKTGLFELEYLGKLNSYDPETDPIFLFSGKTCQTCTEGLMIYGFRASSGKSSTFVYPGKLQDPKSKRVVFQSRLFIGKCIKNKREDVLIVFQEEKEGRKKEKGLSVLVAQPGPYYLKEVLLEKGLPRLDATLKRVKAKECHEIAGQNRLMLSKPLDVHLKNDTEKKEDPDDDDDEDDNDTAKQATDPSMENATKDRNS